MGLGGRQQKQSSVNAGAAEASQSPRRQRLQGGAGFLSRLRDEKRARWSGFSPPKRKDRCIPLGAPSAKKLQLLGEQSRGRLLGFDFVLLNDVLGQPYWEYCSATRRSKLLMPTTCTGLGGIMQKRQRQIQETM